MLVLLFDRRKAEAEVEKHKEMLLKTKLPLNLDYKSKLDSQNSLAVNQIYYGYPQYYLVFEPCSK